MIIIILLGIFGVLIAILCTIGRPLGDALDQGRSIHQLVYGVSYKERRIIRGLIKQRSFLANGLLNASINEDESELCVTEPLIQALRDLDTTLLKITPTCDQEIFQADKQKDVRK
jgi:hypothetical protein